nr:hypothetical protein [uncultured Sphingomonas sp.]
MTAPIAHHAFTLEQARPPRGLVARSRVLLAGLVLIGIAASSQRFILAPGFELYTGPLFYLLAYWLFGLRIGLAMAFATMAPT